MLENEINVFEESDGLTKAKFYFCYKTSIVCLDLLCVIRSLLESNESYLFIITAQECIFDDQYFVYRIGFNFVC